MLRLKELREAKKISQQKLASDMGVSQAAISKYEQGLAEPDINTIKWLSKYFFVSTDYFLGISDLKQSITKSDLSNDELGVVLTYRALNPMQKQIACAFIKGLSENENPYSL